MVHHNRLSPTAVKRSLATTSAESDAAVTRDRDVLINTASQLLNVPHSERSSTTDGLSTAAVPGTSQATVSVPVVGERVGQSEDQTAGKVVNQFSGSNRGANLQRGHPLPTQIGDEPQLPVPTPRRSMRQRLPPDRYSPTLVCCILLK